MTREEAEAKALEALDMDLIKFEQLDAYIEFLLEKHASTKI